MENKKYSEVLIDGKIYSLSGTEDQQYLQKVASYISDKTAQLKGQEGFTKQSQEYQAVMVELNIADDYFKALDKAAVSDRKRDSMERDSYSLKHELVTTQMGLEKREQELSEARREASGARKEAAEAKQELAEAKQELAGVKKELEEMKQELADVRKQYKEDRDELLKLQALQAAYDRAGNGGNQGNPQQHRGQNGGYNQNYNNNRR